MPHASLVCGDKFDMHDVSDAIELNETANLFCNGGQIFYGDYLGFLHTLPSDSVDLCITDPPYWTLNKWRNIGTTTRLGGALNPENQDGDKFFETIDAADLWELIIEIGRVLKKNAHLWMMCDGQTLAHLLAIVINEIQRAENEAGYETPFMYFKPFPVIKRAASGGYRAGMGYHGRATHEYIVLLEKGRRRFNEENFVDVFEPVWDGDSWSKQFTPDGKKYPTAKPLSLMESLLRYSSNEGETVIDPFSGSGVLAVAAKNLNRTFKVSDHSKRAILTTANACNGLTSKNLPLFPALQGAAP